jgi:flagellar biogenesis protein FliO
MPKFARIVLACLICLAVVGGAIWLIQRLAA